MAEAERVTTGITGMDELVQGGFLKGSANLIAGTAGAGKTIFCLQFLLEGLKKGENCMFVTFEESPDDIRKDALTFGWDLKPYEKKEQFFIGYRPPFKSEDLYFFENEIRKYKITRIALDSTSVLGMTCASDFEVRKELFKLVEVIKKTGATSVLTAEITSGDPHILSRFGVEEFIVDAVIALRRLDGGEKSLRSLQITKMRRTKHSEDVHPLEITPNGIEIHTI